MSDIDLNPAADLPKAANLSLNGLHISPPMARAMSNLCEAGADLSDHLELIKSVDWANTSLGPVGQWSQELATQFHLMMLNPTPQSLTLGTDSIVIYNPAYADLIRDHHPSFFGKPIATWTAWRQYFASIQRVMGKAAAIGRAVEEKDFVMYLPKNGILEEISLFITVIRLPAPLSGFLTTFQDNTTQMVRDRRISSLKEFSECWKSSVNMDDLWTKILNQLSDRPRQFCFTALYTATLAFDTGNASDSSNAESEDIAYALHPMSPAYETTPESLKIVELAPPNVPLVILMRKSHSTRAPVLISGQDIPHVWQDLARRQGYRDDVRKAVILPSSSNKLSKVQAFLVLGLSTRRGYDEHYKTFFLEVQRLLADAVNNLISVQETIKKKMDLAKRARIEKELMEKELQIRREQAELAQLKMGRLSSTAESVE